MHIPLISVPIFVMKCLHAVLLLGVCAINAFYFKNPTLSLTSDLKPNRKIASSNMKEEDNNTLANLTTSSLRNNGSASIFVCGYSVFDNVLLSDIFNDFKLQGQLKAEQLPILKPEDILMVGQRGPCPIKQGWIMDNFPGKVVFINGEAYGPYYTKGNKYVIGNIDSETPTHSLFFPYGLATLWRHPHSIDLICDPSMKQKNSAEHFLVYVNSNCVPYREKVFRKLSSIGPVHYGGACNGGRGIEGNVTNRIKLPRSQVHERLSRERNNPTLYSRYRFCLVMENAKSPGYMTEKIIYAFLGGCVPIWYGDEIIFDIFNKDAFLFINVASEDDINSVIKHILYLETNKAAYMRILGEPILANGTDTINKYFSMFENIGGGELRTKLRQLLQI